jgi:hypothetical protein
MSEHVIMREAREKLAKLGNGLIWRNNVGKFWTLGTSACCMHCGGNLLGGRAVRGASITACGLGVGSADLIGLHRVTVTPEMVGTAIGRFVGIEMKTATGRERPEQLQWRQVVQRYGGIAGTARSADDALALVEVSR